MIKEIYLENWKSHEKSFIQFDKVNLIIGKMGSGKTSITDAISYALFGNFSDLNSKKIKLEDVIMKKPIEKNFSKIILKLQINNKEYEIVRIIEKGKGSYSEIKENGKIVVSGTTEANNFIKKILKTDFDTFINVVYAEQNKIDFFLNLERGERKVRFDEMIGIEKMERIRKTTVSLKNRLLDIHKEKDKFLSQLKSENLEEKLKEIKNQINEINKKVESYKKIKNDIESIVNDLEKKVENGRKIEKTINELEKEKTKIDANINNLEKLIEEISKEVGNLERKNLENEIESIKKQIEEINFKIEEIASKLNELEKNKELLTRNLLETKIILEKKEKLIKELEELKDVEEKINEISNEIEKLKISEEEKNIQLKNIETEIEKLNDIIKLLEGEDANCPVCKSSLTKEKKERLQEEYRKLVVNLSIEKEKLKNELNELKKRLNELNILEKEFSMKKIMVENLKSELEKLKDYNETSKIKIEEELKNVKDEIEKRKNEKERMGEELIKLNNFIKEKS